MNPNNEVESLILQKFMEKEKKNSSTLLNPRFF